MSDINKENNFEGNEYSGDEFNKLNKLLSNMFGLPNLNLNKPQDDDDDDDSKRGEPIGVEVLIKGDWKITITSWKSDDGVVTEKIEIDGPSKELPKEIEDFIKERVASKKNGRLLKNSKNIDDLIDSIFKSEREKYESKESNSKMTDNDFNSVNQIAKYWFFNKTPDFDKLIDEALEKEEYENAAYLRDKKEHLKTFNEVTLDKLQEAIQNADFIAIDSIISAYKSRLPEIIKLR